MLNMLVVFLFEVELCMLITPADVNFQIISSAIAHHLITFDFDRAVLIVFEL